MCRQALVTVVTRNYLHYAAVLQQSCKRLNPQADFFVVLADELPSSLASAHQLDTLVPAQQLLVGDWARFTFQYTPFELSCALKPYAMEHLLSQGYDSVVFLDGDVALYGPLNSMTQALQSHSVALTPHLLRPLPRDGRKPAENNFLNTGTFNGGVVGCCGDQVGLQFIQWWKDHLRHDCYVDVAGGVFVNQKWLNLVPSLFPSVAIVRQPGCNTGHWTLSQFSLTGDRESGYRVGDQPLECFHFSNFLPDNPYEFMHSQTRVSFQTTPALEQLVRDYHQQLIAQGAERFSALGCQFDHLSDGTPIKPEWREAIRRNIKDLRNVADPFDVTANSSLVKRFDSAARRAHKWRGDWRTQLPSQQLKKKSRKRWKNYWRYLTSRR